MGPIVSVLNLILNVISLGLFVYIVTRMLVSFEVVNPRAKAVVMILDGLGRIYEPVLEPIRKRIGQYTGALDLSPLVLLLAIEIVRAILNSILL